jgi:hypothetical protein
MSENVWWFPSFELAHATDIIPHQSVQAKSKLFDR